jgi:hypothetical protein
MQTRMSTEYRLISRHFAATARFAMPHGDFTRDQPGRELGVVDGLVSVTQRAWRLDLGIGKRDDGEQ